MLYSMYSAECFQLVGVKVSFINGIVKGILSLWMDIDENCYLVKCTCHILGEVAKWSNVLTAVP